MTQPTADTDTTTIPAAEATETVTTTINTQEAEAVIMEAPSHQPLAPSSVETEGIIHHDDVSEEEETSCEVKCVQFDDQVQIIKVKIDLRIQKHKWYRKNDYKRFQHEKKETLRHFRFAQSKFQRIEEDIFCLRGFEACLSARAVQQKLLRRVAGIQAVLDTQYHLRRKGVSDPSRRIQNEYYKVTTLARNQALERAALDAREVLDEGEQQQREQELPSPSELSMEILSLKHQFDRLMHTKAGGAVQPTLRSATSGPLQLRKTVPSTA